MRYTPATPTLWLCETLANLIAGLDAWRVWSNTDDTESALARIVWFGNRRSTTTAAHDDATNFPLIRIEQGDTASHALTKAFAREPYLGQIAIRMVFEAEPKPDLDSSDEHADFVERTEALLYAILSEHVEACTRSLSITQAEMSEPHTPPSEPGDEKVWRVVYTFTCEGWFRA